MATQHIAPEEDFGPILELFSELDRMIQSAASGRMIGLVPITLRAPATDPPIHAFYTMVSWLYVLIIESGPIHFHFLSERAAALGLDASGELPRFCGDVQIFRTVLQHNLDLSDANDLAKVFRCEGWMASLLETSLSPGERFWPNQESQWRSLAGALRAKAKRFGEINISTLKHILEDEFAEDVLREWIFRQTRSFSAHEFDDIAAQAAGDLGLAHIDVVRLRKIHLDEWNRRIRLLSEGTDKKREARQIVEQSLLVEAENYLPINGGDVIETMGVPPGPEVGKALRKARELYQKNPCSREELLKQLSSRNTESAETKTSTMTASPLPS
jgi:hypothetical protein